VGWQPVMSYSVIIMEELYYRGISGLMIPLHSDIIVHYIDSFGNEEQKTRWLPGCVSGEIITAIAMTEPDVGSDLAANKDIRCEGWRQLHLERAETFISNGIHSKSGHRCG